MPRSARLSPAEPGAKRRVLPGTAGMRRVRTNTARESTQRSSVGVCQVAPRFTGHIAWDVIVDVRAGVALARCLAEPGAKRWALPGTAGMEGCGRTQPANQLGAPQSACARWRFASPGTSRGTSSWTFAWAWRSRGAWLSPARGAGRCLAQPGCTRCGRTQPANRLGALRSACARWRFASPGTSRGTSSWAFAWAFAWAWRSRGVRV